MQERQQARQPASQPASQRWGMLTGPLRALGPGSFRGAHCLDRAVHCARRAVRSELEPLRVALELKGVGLEASLVERVAWRLRGRLQWAETVRVCADRETHARARSAPQSQVTMKQQGVHARTSTTMVGDNIPCGLRDPTLLPHGGLHVWEREIARVRSVLRSALRALPRRVRARDEAAAGVSAADTTWRPDGSAAGVMPAAHRSICQKRVHGRKQ
jgi:hypothetical protein